MRIGAIHSRRLWATPGMIAESLANIERPARKKSQNPIRLHKLLQIRFSDLFDDGLTANRR
jgi:hypothetical protein